MAKKDSTIIYDKHVDICSEYLTDEQFGRLMFALVRDESPDFGDDALLSMAYAFISLQKKLDDEKYAAMCERNRRNGALGGAPKGNRNAKKGNKNNPKQPNGFQNNPNDNDNEKEKEKEKDNDNENDAGLFHDNPSDSSADQSFSSFGEYDNVELTQDQRKELADRFERSGTLIDEVSEWIRNAKNHVPDHYGLCLRWAKKAGWPKRRQIEPVEEIKVEDPLSEEEQERRVADMRARLNVALG